MSYDSSGVYTLPSGSTVVTGTTISSTVHNAILNDLATALDYAIVKDGQSPIIDSILFDNYKALLSVDEKTYIQALDNDNEIGVWVGDDSGGGGGGQRLDFMDEATLLWDIFTSLGAATALTIASGAITATRSYHTIDTQSAVSSDDLDTINGAGNGLILVIQAADSARTVVCKDGTGNLLLAGDFSLDHTDDKLVLCGEGTDWIEISRSSNG